MKFECNTNYGNVSNGGKFHIEFNYGRWDNNPLCYDLRRWNGEVCSKGITFKEYELCDLIRFTDEAIKADKPDIPIYKNEEPSHVDWKIYGVYGPIADARTKAKYITYIDWGHGPRYDIRWWSKDFQSCDKGVSFSESELVRLLDIFSKASPENNSARRKEDMPKLSEWGDLASALMPD